MDSTDKQIWGLPPRLVAFIAAVVVLAAGVLGVSAARIVSAPPHLHEWLGIGLFLGLALIADLHPVPLDDKGSQVSLAFVFLIAVLVIFGWQAAAPPPPPRLPPPPPYPGRPVGRATVHHGAHPGAAASA